MKIIVMANQKGGVGKTTLAGHLGVMAEQENAGPVAFLDADPQCSLLQWWEGREAETPVFSAATIDNLSSNLERLEKIGIKLVIIDTPAGVAGHITTFLNAADLVLIPTRPSPHDLRAVGTTIEMVEKARKPMIFIINNATPRARITADTAFALSQHGTVAPVILYQRIDFAASMTDGRTVQEANPESKSTLEVKRLWLYLQNRISKTIKD